MRDYALELENRVAFIRQALNNAHSNAIVYGNSGGKDSALVGILCKKACENTLGVLMPCQSKRNFEEDMKDGLAVADQFHIDYITVDLTPVKEAMLGALTKSGIAPTGLADANINPRLRMTTLYSVAANRGALVAGTGNRSEAYMGYFTKWGDGAYDFNPIADLTVTEIYEFLAFLNAPENIIKKAPSAGLFEGQTDEKEMGVSYAAIDEYLNTGHGEPDAIAIMERYHARSAHKRRMPLTYPASK